MTCEGREEVSVGCSVVRAAARGQSEGILCPSVRLCMARGQPSSCREEALLISLWSLVHPLAAPLLDLPRSAAHHRSAVHTQRTRAADAPAGATGPEEGALSRLTALPSATSVPGVHLGSPSRAITECVEGGCSGRSHSPPPVLPATPTPTPTPHPPSHPPTNTRHPTPTLRPWRGSRSWRSRASTSAWGWTWNRTVGGERLLQGLAAPSCSNLLHQRLGRRKCQRGTPAVHARVERAAAIKLPVATNSAAPLRPPRCRLVCERAVHTDRGPGSEHRGPRHVVGQGGGHVVAAHSWVRINSRVSALWKWRVQALALGAAAAQLPAPSRSVPCLQAG